MPEPLCGLALDNLPTDETEKATALLDAKELLQIILPHGRDSNVFETG